MSTSSTPMFCLLVKAPISSQIKTTKVDGHNNENGSFCLRRVLYSRSFNPVRAAQTIFCRVRTPAVNVTVPGISGCSLAAYPSRVNAAARYEAETDAVVPLITDKRAHITRRICANEHRGYLHLVSLSLFHFVLVDIPRLMLIRNHRCFSLLVPVKEVCGST